VTVPHADRYAQLFYGKIELHYQGFDENGNNQSRVLREFPRFTIIVYIKNFW